MVIIEDALLENGRALASNMFVGMCDGPLPQLGSWRLILMGFLGEIRVMLVLEL